MQFSNNALVPSLSAPSSSTCISPHSARQSVAETSALPCDPIMTQQVDARIPIPSQKENKRDRLKRSRERNRVHAQKTRQRKKEQMLTLKTQAAELKDEQIRLKQMINEKATATILVHLFAEGSPPNEVESCNIDDPAVEELLRRSHDAIPDSSHIQELPALILPGQHASKKINKSDYTVPLSTSGGISADDIDYELLGRDRSQCSVEELDRIRRERNRMHAKRTRDRKRIYTEKLSELCRQLEDENVLLHEHAKKMDPNYEYKTLERTIVVTTMTPYLKIRNDATNTMNHKFDNQIVTLLQAAEREYHEISDAASACGSEDPPPRKKQRVPDEITTASENYEY